MSAETGSTLSLDAKWGHRWTLRPSVPCATSLRLSLSAWNAGTDSAGDASRIYGASTRTGRTVARSRGVKWCTKLCRSSGFQALGSHPANGVLNLATLQVQFKNTVAKPVFIYNLKNLKLLNLIWIKYLYDVILSCDFRLLRSKITFPKSNFLEQSFDFCSANNQWRKILRMIWIIRVCIPH